VIITNNDIATEVMGWKVERTQGGIVERWQDRKGYDWLGDFSPLVSEANAMEVVEEMVRQGWDNFDICRHDNGEWTAIFTFPDGSIHGYAAKEVFTEAICHAALCAVRKKRDEERQDYEEEFNTDQLSTTEAALLEQCNLLLRRIETLESANASLTEVDYALEDEVRARDVTIAELEKKVGIMEDWIVMVTSPFYPRAKEPR
jgi:hypothetical protein